MSYSNTPHTSNKLDAISHDSIIKDPKDYKMEWTIYFLKPISLFIPFYSIMYPKVIFSRCFKNIFFNVDSSDSILTEGFKICKTFLKQFRMKVERSKQMKGSLYLLVFRFVATAVI
jgi:hypothetical protein